MALFLHNRIRRQKPKNQIDMENYEKMDGFLEECIKGNSGFAVVYEIQSDGGIGRRKYTFDGNDMYVLSARAAWREDNHPRVEYISYTKIKDWSYTDKGWFCYEMCVPEPPEVTEIVDGSCLLRIRPMSEEQKELSEKLDCPIISLEDILYEI